ncbi:MAG: hypothetical protein ACHQ5A_11270 [Opitutales bacterium]
MVHVITPLKTAAYSLHTAPKQPRPVRATGAASGSATTTSGTTASASSGTAPDFRTLFTPKTTSPAGESPAVPATPAPSPVPTAESVFGPNPWIANPTGIGPNGSVYSYNPFYFATAQTAATVAQMVGGTVVQSNSFTPNGGAFAQQQPNYMVQLADGRIINPGLVASFYTHGYPQSYVDQMVACEVRNA